MSDGVVIDGSEYYSKLIGMFNNFFKSGVMSSTYKAVFLRSLVDVGKYGDDSLIGKQWIHHERDKIRLDLDFIAVRFAKYYWDMEVAFKMRHMPERMADHNDPSRDVRIIALIREKAADLKRQQIINDIKNMSFDTINKSWKMESEIQNILQLLNPPTLEVLASDSMKKFRTDVIKEAIKPEVLPHLLTDMPELYQRIHGQNYIMLNFSIIRFMQEFSTIINKALNYVLAVHLEKHNPSARHIAVKIDNERDFEQRLEQVKKLEVKVRHKFDEKSDVERTA